MADPTAIAFSPKTRAPNFRRKFASAAEAAHG